MARKPGKTGDSSPKPSNDEDLDDHDSLRRLTSSQKKPQHRSHLGMRLRNYFLTGLIIAGPVGITFYIIWWFINLIDAWVKPFVPARYLPDTYLPFTVPGVGLIFSMTAIMLIGFFAANLFGRTLVGYSELMLDRMPVVRNVYRALKQIFETVLSKSSNSFQYVGLIEYPRRGLMAIVFVSTETTGEIKNRADDGNGLLSVFLPTTPNPTSGFLLFVPKKDITILDMSVEEAAKLVISAGLVVPDVQQEQLQALAAEAKQAEKSEPAAEAGPEPEDKAETETEPSPAEEPKASTGAKQPAKSTAATQKRKPRPRRRRPRQSSKEPAES